MHRTWFSSDCWTSGLWRAAAVSCEHRYAVCSVWHQICQPRPLQLQHSTGPLRFISAAQQRRNRSDILIIIITPTISNAPYNMLESLQGRGVRHRQFVISRRSGNVNLVPSWMSQLSRLLIAVLIICASAVDSRPYDPPQQMHGCQSSWQRRRQLGRHEWRIGVSVCYRRLWLVDRGRRCTTVPVHAAPCMSAEIATSY